MIVLDTNVLSEFMIHTPDVRVVNWLNSQPRSSVWTASVSVYEIRSGLLTMPQGRRQAALSSVFERLLNHTIEGRIAVFDAAAAERAAELEAAGLKSGRPRDRRDHGPGFDAENNWSCFAHSGFLTQHCTIAPGAAPPNPSLPFPSSPALFSPTTPRLLRGT